MSTYFINIEDSFNEGDEFITYEGIKIFEDKNELFRSNTGDFIKDWYLTIKKLVTSSNSLPPISVSSQINHLSDFGFDFESGYLHYDSNNEKYILKFFDRSAEDWWLTTDIDNGVEFFVPDNTWTWEKLTNYCKNVYDFPLYEHLYNKEVKMDDRFESEHIWSYDLALKNAGRWIPKEK